MRDKMSSKNEIEEKLFIIFTMDCERILKYSPTGGPETWEFSENTIKSFLKVLIDHDLSGTFFIVPNTAEKHVELFLEAQDCGFELGMHYHPQSFQYGRYNKYLGEYNYKEQLRQLSEAIKVWENALGFRPSSFRPGNCSANEFTYKVLYELGFRQGSTYIPNRYIPKWHAIWTNANPFPHHIKGIDFLEVPITADIEEKVRKGDPVHLRIEGYDENTLCSLVEKWINILVKREIILKTIVVITHNSIDYFSKESKYVRRLKKLIKSISNASRKFDLELVPINLRKLHELVDKFNLPI